MEIKVIDVSKHQGKIDWAKVKAVGNIDGVIIRCGYGRDILKQDDERFKENADACIKYGIPFGVYLYSYAKTVDDAKSEAEHVLRLIAPYKDNLSYPVYYDLEEAGTEKGAVERAIVFGDIIEKNGYWCGIYANQHWWRSYLKSGLNRFTKWVAKYSSSKPSGISGTYDIWQYSSSGTVAGINGRVDMNICYRDFPAEIRNKTVAEVSKYYNKYYGSSGQIDEVFKAIGVPSAYIGKWKNRKAIADANGISMYVGTGAQNKKLIELAKQGRLLKV